LFVNIVARLHHREAKDLLDAKMNFYHCLRDILLVTFAIFGLWSMMAKKAVKASKKGKATYSKKIMEKNAMITGAILLIKCVLFWQVYKLYKVVSGCYCCPNSMKGGRHLQAEDNFWIRHQTFTFDQNLDGEQMHIQLEMPSENEVNGMM